MAKQSEKDEAKEEQGESGKRKKPADPVRERLKAREAAYRALVAERIKSLRDVQGDNQDGLAAKAHLHRSHMGFIEQGKNDPTLATLLKIADALGMSVSEMLELPEEALEGLPPVP